ncbi:unnamed protein product [Spirodela intermedia]|uniref:Uncharacterized protein n=1 Tax=Spirodela intermedia TaxID=51605 RepID=A0A7I8I7K5_SPIIN|nr:unnamed protein product [Spirodela intermedia]CAA6653596.1 unnamed protein product [Spirodela intermedia]
MMTTISSLKETTEALLSVGSGAAAGGGALEAAPPRDPDWLIPFGFILVSFFAIACIMAIVMSRWGSCKEKTYAYSYSVSIFEHECLVGSLAAVLFIVISLASLYYYFCFSGGCFGGGWPRRCRWPPAGG